MWNELSTLCGETSPQYVEGLIVLRLWVSLYRALG